ncbi:MAG: hypothetical protein EZS28_026037, partial [Streblomastix strix]
MMIKYETNQLKQRKKQKKREERKRRRIIGLGDVYDGFDEISYDSPDFFERDEEESMMFNQKVLGTEKRSDETDEEFKKRVAKLLSAVMKREGLSDEKEIIRYKRIETCLEIVTHFIGKQDDPGRKLAIQSGIIRAIL